MDSWLTTFFADPMYFVGLVFAFVAAMGFLIFLRGFLSGTPHLFTISGRDDHLKLYRTRQAWGFFILLFLFIVWELLRWVLGII